MDYIIAPSILSADFKALGTQVQEVAEAGAKYIHIDVMDGSFVPSISFGMPVIQGIRSCTDAVFDVHMMVQDPGRYIQAVKEAGADVITVHAEACTHLDRVVNQIKEVGCRVGVALNPATSIYELDCILPHLDMVLIMSVNPGFGGQRFIPYTLDKIRALRETMRQRGIQADIQVDGGVSTGNLSEIMDAGANIFVAGSAIYGGDAAAGTREFVKLFEEYKK